MDQNQETLWTRLKTVALLVTIVILLITSFWLYEQNNQIKNTVLPKANCEPGVVTDFIEEHYQAMEYVVAHKEGWETYTDQEYNFQFQYPPITELSIFKFRPEWENSPSQGPVKNGIRVGLCLPPYGCQDYTMFIEVSKDVLAERDIESYLGHASPNHLGTIKWEDSTFLGYPSKVSGNIIIIKKNNDLYKIVGPNESSDSSDDYTDRIWDETFKGVLSSFSFTE